METDRERRLKEKLGGWYELLKDEFIKPYMINLGKWLAAERKEVYVYPEADNMFRAFKLTPPDQVKVIILGQDPYHDGHADGLAFSSKDRYHLPPTLDIVFREIETDIYEGLQLGLYENTELSRWAEQGILLLNTILTVEKDKALSHERKGWESFTGRSIVKAHYLDQPIVWLLWGKTAQNAYDRVIQVQGGPNPKHLIIRSAHPAAELYKATGGFYGSKPFSQANEFLQKHNLKEITW